MPGACINSVGCAQYKDKGCVDDKVGRQVGKHGLSQAARAMTPPPFRRDPSGPGLECSVQISGILQQP
jgi:hypothetical protein